MRAHLTLLLASLALAAGCSDPPPAATPPADAPTDLAPTDLSPTDLAPPAEGQPVDNVGDEARGDSPQAGDSDLSKTPPVDVDAINREGEPKLPKDAP